MARAAISFLLIEAHALREIGRVDSLRRLGAASLRERDREQ